MAGTAGAPRAGSALRRRAAGTAGALLALRRHRVFGVQLGGGDHQDALGALARNQHFAFFASFEDPFEAVKTQAGFGFFSTMAVDAGVFKHRTDVLFVSNARFISGRRELGQIDGFSPDSGPGGRQAHATGYEQILYFLHFSR